MRFAYKAIVSLILVALASGDALAHARWFLVNEQVPSAPPLQLDAITAGLIFLSVLILAGGCALDAFSRTRNFGRYLHSPVGLRHHLDWRLLSVAFGSMLIVNSMNQVFVSPDLPLGSATSEQLVAFFQIVVGAMFVLQARLLVASVLTLLLPFFCWILHSFWHSLDYAFELFGIGAALFLVAPVISIVDRSSVLMAVRQLPAYMMATWETPIGPMRVRWEAPPLRTFAARAAWREDRLALAARTLRVLLGLQLIVLAAHDKLLYPGISLAFVDKYSFVNVPALLGFQEFTNLHFVVGAGLCETTFGLLLMAGIATRPLSLALLAVFTLTGIMFGFHELVGHLPIMAALVVIARAGSPNLAASYVDPSRVARGYLVLGSCVCASIVSTFLINAPALPGASAAINAGTISSTLYRRFVEGRRGSLSGPRELTRADTAVRQALVAVAQGGEIDKDDLARRMFELSVRYEATFGRDAASFWLRYAHLTAACSHDDLRAFRARVTSGGWEMILQKAPRELVAELAPIARRSAELLVQRLFDADDTSFWSTAAVLAPDAGPRYIHTHILASIVRIIEQATAEAAG